MQCVGKCAKCMSDSISYGSTYPTDAMLYYEYTCDDCQHEGNEWYELTYMESD